MKLFIAGRPAQARSAAPGGGKTPALQGGRFTQASRFDVKTHLQGKTPDPNAACGRNFLARLPEGRLSSDRVW